MRRIVAALALVVIVGLWPHHIQISHHARICVDPLPGVGALAQGVVRCPGT